MNQFISSCFPQDPREWKQTFQIKPVGIDEAVIVNLEMMCQCDCEKPGNPVSTLIISFISVAKQDVTLEMEIF